jgi:hypothetical protein
MATTTVPPETPVETTRPWTEAERQTLGDMLAGVQRTTSPALLPDRPYAVHVTSVETGPFIREFATEGARGMWLAVERGRVTVIGLIDRGPADPFVNVTVATAEERLLADGRALTPSAVHREVLDILDEDRDYVIPSTGQRVA